jgi:hypothetical protein
MRTHGKHSKDTITNKTRPAGSFSSIGSQAGRLAGPVFYVYCICLFSWDSGPAGVIFTMMDGPYRLTLPDYSICLVRAAQLRADDISSCADIR